MKSLEVKLDMPHGMHARPATVFVKEAGKFQSEITLTCDGTSVNGKSIMGLLMLALGPGSLVTVSAAGPDEEKALESLREVLLGKLT